ILASMGGNMSLGSDVANGPYSQSSTSSLFWQNKSWQICQEEIDIYTTWWEACQGPNQDPQACANGQVPTNASLTRIYDWPAHGDISLGEPYWLAPFFDYNNDGMYSPNDGDYPIIKGGCATWRIENDETPFAHEISGTDALGIEMQHMTYQYRNYGLLNDVTFVEVIAINRSNQTYYDFSYGIHTDMFVGDATDDYVGSDSLKNLYYVYNSSDTDALLGVDPGVIGIVALQDSLSSVINFDTQNNINDTWDLMNGNYPGTVDILDAQGNPTSFLYHDNPNISGGYSQEAQTTGFTSPQAFIASKRNTYAPGDTLRQTFAFVYVNEGSRLQSVDAMYQAADELQIFFDTIANAQCEDGVLSTSTMDESIGVQLLPNPASNYVDVVVNASGAFVVSLLDMTGKIIASEKGESMVSLNLSDLANGAYVVHIQSGTSIFTEKLLVDH
ncbi:T9SS type A sorting domain-containing protein, partial [Crocinitomicaceae bacterium]|nr:T9SS type A sorting domain-containing protein [Crocinitomicaceae bacterium]